LKESSRKLYQQYRDIVADIVLFGSFAKGKISPEDIDVCIILKRVEQKDLIQLREKFNIFFPINVHINLVMVDNLMQNSLLRTLIEEGYSLLNNKPFNEPLDYTSGAIFSININKLNKSRKVLFSYALHGKKGKEGMISKLKGRLIGRLVVFVPISHIDEFKQFLELWDANYYMNKVLL